MEKVCPHYHLSLQSGCDETLKRMNRRYTTKEYKEIVDRLRENIPNVAITTDVIVGFPGETNDEFNKTYEFLKEIELPQSLEFMQDTYLSVMVVMVPLYLITAAFAGPSACADYCGAQTTWYMHSYKVCNS